MRISSCTPLTKYALLLSSLELENGNTAMPLSITPAARLRLNQTAAINDRATAVIPTPRSAFRLGEPAIHRVADLLHLCVRRCWRLITPGTAGLPRSSLHRL